MHVGCSIKGKTMLKFYINFILNYITVNKFERQLANKANDDRFRLVFKYNFARELQSFFLISDKQLCYDCR